MRFHTGWVDKRLSRHRTPHPRARPRLRIGYVRSGLCADQVVTLATVCRQTEHHLWR